MYVKCVIIIILGEGLMKIQSKIKSQRYSGKTLYCSLSQYINGFGIFFKLYIKDNISHEITEELISQKLFDDFFSIIADTDDKYIEELENEDKAASLKNKVRILNMVDKCPYPIIFIENDVPTSYSLDYLTKTAIANIENNQNKGVSEFIYSYLSERKRPHILLKKDSLKQTSSIHIVNVFDDEKVFYFHYSREIYNISFHDTLETIMSLIKNTSN